MTMAHQRGNVTKIYDHVMDKVMASLRDSKLDESVLAMIRETWHKKLMAKQSPVPSIAKRNGAPTPVFVAPTRVIRLQLVTKPGVKNEGIPIRVPAHLVEGN